MENKRGGTAGIARPRRRVFSVGRERKAVMAVCYWEKEPVRFFPYPQIFVTAFYYVVSMK